MPGYTAWKNKYQWNNIYNEFSLTDK